MSKKIGLLALGGHISNQNATFNEMMRQLSGSDWEFYGLRNGFEAFKTGEVYPMDRHTVFSIFAGFYAGATRASLTKKDGTLDDRMVEDAVSFSRATGFDYLVGSGGDDHGIQMNILGEILESKGIPTKVLVSNKTMDGDKGGKDGETIGGYVGPFADTTNGFHTAINQGVNVINTSLSGAWTNEVVTIVPHFGRDANWVNLALGWYGNADVVIPGEFPEGHPGHSIDTIAKAIMEAREGNLRRYGRAFATVVVSEGTKIEGIEQASSTLRDTAHGHVKLNPEILAVGLKEALDKYGLKSQSEVVTYSMRNSRTSNMDGYLATLTGQTLATAILEGITGMEAVLKFDCGVVVSKLVPINLASQKRFARYREEHTGRPFYDRVTLKPLPEIGDYFRPLFVDRKEIESLLPRKPTVVNVYSKPQITSQ